MPAPETTTVVIACPHCGTRYQVAFGTIGSKGRTVQCAHCLKSWLAHAEVPLPAEAPEGPTPPQPAAQPQPPKREVRLNEIAEQVLDENFAAEERRQLARQARRVEAATKAEAVRSEAHQRTLEQIKAAVSPKAAAASKAAAAAAGAAAAEPADAAASPDRAKRNQLQREFSRRQESVSKSLPMARLRRAARLAALCGLVLLIGGGVLFRVQIVQQFPPLAGDYAALGLGVNVIGLEFRDVHTLKSLQQGAEVLVVDGSIHSVANQQVTVPQVIVTLLGPDGQALYEWSVVPKAAELEPGEVIAFETQLSSPPAGADTVKLTFATGRTQSTIPAEPPHSAPPTGPK
jgi:predicted Zn finger-like uncharacterized protein